MVGQSAIHKRFRHHEQRKNFTDKGAVHHLDALEGGSWKPSFQFDPRAVHGEHQEFADHRNGCSNGNGHADGIMYNISTYRAQ